MGDIERAVAREEEYLAHRMRGEEPFHLVDAVRECGFGSLDDYFAAKREHEFGKVEFGFKECPPSECIGEFFRMMDAGESGLVFIESDHTFVFSGESKPYDAQYCEENGIPVYPLHTKGGAIVSTEGDFSIGICYPDSVDADVRFILDRLGGIFGRHMDGVEVAGNDLLLNGRKICGSIMYQRNGMRCFACHFSFKDNSELIGKICGASGSVKVPTVISGISVALFKEAVKAWLRVRSI